MSGPGPDHDLAAWYAEVAAASCLELLTEDVLRTEDLLDSATLSAVASASDSGPKFKRVRSECNVTPGDSSPHKLETWDDSGDEFDGTACDDKHGSKKTGKPNSTAAARSKACREKARRERINERFVELATLIGQGKEPKIDKSSILGDAIKAFQQLMAENNQLKQLNKFLEERVGQLEKAQGQQLYQYAIYQQQTAQMLQPRSHATSSTSCVQPLVTGVPCMQPGALQSAVNPGGVNQASLPCDLPHTLLQQQLMLQDTHTGPPSFRSALPNNANLPSGAHNPIANTPTRLGGLQPGLLNLQGDVFSSSRLPYLMPGSAMDHWQDSLLRPPAA